MTIHMNAPRLGFAVHRKIRRNRSYSLSSEALRNQATIYLPLVSSQSNLRCAMRPLGLIYYSLVRLLLLIQRLPEKAEIAFLDGEANSR
jgi:hypothetical protein